MKIFRKVTKMTRSMVKARGAYVSDVKNRTEEEEVKKFTRMMHPVDSNTVLFTPLQTGSLPVSAPLLKLNYNSF